MAQRKEPDSPALLPVSARKARRPTVAIRSGTHLRRILDNALVMGLDPILSTAIGRLALTKQLTPRLLASAEWLRKTTHRWDYFQERSRHSRSPKLEAGTPSVVGDFVEFEWEAQYRAAKWDWQMLHGIPIDDPDNLFASHSRIPGLLDQFPRRAVDLAHRLCVEDEWLLPAELNDVRAVLAAISDAIEDMRKRTTDTQPSSVIRLSDRRGRAKADPKRTWCEGDARPTDTTLKDPDK